MPPLPLRLDREDRGGDDDQTVHHHDPHHPGGDVLVLDDVVHRHDQDDDRHDVQPREQLRAEGLGGHGRFSLLSCVHLFRVSCLLDNNRIKAQNVGLVNLNKRTAHTR